MILSDMNIRKLKKYLIFAYILLLLYLLYKLGIPVLYLPIIGIVFLLLVFFKITFYKKIDQFLTNKFPFVGRLPSWGKTILTIVVFLLIFTIAKQIIFLFLKVAGIDVQQAVKEVAKQ